MTQPLHNSLSFLKSANTSNTSLDVTPSTRSRSGSFLRAISLHSPHPSSTPNQGNQSPTTTALTRTNTNSSTTPSFSRHPLHSDETTEFAFSSNPEDFEIKNPIGYGSSAVVYNATYKPKNMRIAIKMIDLDLFERNQIDELRRETALMALSKHPNVLKVYGSFVSGSKLYIATPYLSGGSCLDIMKNGFQDGFEEVIIATILKQALEGLVYLHKNGHIHRDVKAGNLLMDDQGTVLLADFGVSSSLTENNEVRKTFVGTPCWMAPEVMEQSGYDFKADIWSFGITALELTTGHAPFAKFPPMKVLMMTLNQSPPTLDRDHTKHKYSRIFKEMIDMCLCKDPSKRPTAEKLLLHPFFKQAKRKDYLIKSVLAYVPSLEQRPHKKLAFKQTTIENTTQWDFEDDKKLDPNPATVSSDTSAPIQKPHISFGNVVITNEKIDLPSPAPSDPEISSPVPIRKSRFVIEEHHNNSINSNLSLDKNEEATTISSQHSLLPNNISSYGDEMIHPNPDSSIFVHDSANAVTAEHSWQSSIGLGLGISSTTSASLAASLQQQQQQQQLHPLQDNIEVKKGRFSVNQQTASPTIKTTNIGMDPKYEVVLGQTPSQPPESPLETRSFAMSRIVSNEIERKSRFEVQHLPTPTTSYPLSHNSIMSISSSPAIISHGTLDYPQVRFDTLPMAREPSLNHHRSLSRESVSSGKVSRFSIEKEDVVQHQLAQDLVHPFETVSSIAHGSPPEYRKKGRFELTGGMTNAERFESPHTTINGAAVDATHMHQRSSSDQQALSHFVCNHMEALLKQTETQKVMLHDLLYGLNTMHNGGLPHNIPISRGRSSSFDIRKMSNSSMDHLSGLQQHNNLTMESKPFAQNEIPSTVEHLQHLLLMSSREKERLMKENESLKKEVERLRKQQTPPSISTTTAPTVSILLKNPTTTPPIPPVSLAVAAEKSEHPLEPSPMLTPYSTTNHDK